jgi:hypothetical protein
MNSPYVELIMNKSHYFFKTQKFGYQFKIGVCKSLMSHESPSLSHFYEILKVCSQTL